jgi:hypothetical protein
MSVTLRTLLPLAILATCLGCSDDEKQAADDPLDPGVAAGNENRPAGVAHCYTTFSSQHEATRAFWIAFRAGDLEGRAAATAGLAEAAQAYPDEEEFALLNGLSNLWRVAEPTAAELSDTTSFVQAALTSKTELERAYALCPTDHRVPAWLGPVLVNMGRATNDQASIDQGLAVLQQGIDNYPSFVLFSKLLIYADFPRDDPSFQNALDAVTENVSVCTGSDPACTNHKHAAHNIEGASVFLGDVYVKAGNKPSALTSYDLSHTSASFDEWNYQATLEDRLTNLDTRLTAFASTDTADDPQSIWQSNYQCSICHVQ